MSEQHQQEAQDAAEESSAAHAVTPGGGLSSGTTAASGQTELRVKAAQAARGAAGAAAGGGAPAGKADTDAAAQPLPDGTADAASAQDGQEPPTAITLAGPTAIERGATVRERLSKADVIKFIGLAAFLVICIVAVVLLWPIIGSIFTDGGDTLEQKVQEAGPAGVFILLAVQVLQVIVAFIPGEVVQVAAGMIYGTWGGFAVVLVGCILSSALVYWLVHKLGAPFVRDMVSTKYLNKFIEFEKSGKLDIIVFVLFLIPGLPKDVFTYLVPLTGMPMGRFLLLSTLGRIPGMWVSTFAANQITQGNIWTAIIIFGAAAVIAIFGVIYKDKIMGFFTKRTKSSKKE